MGKGPLAIKLGWRFLNKLWQVVPVLIGVSLLIFLAVKMLPGDPAKLMLGERASETELASLREKLGLNHSWPVQYGRFAGKLVALDLGESIRTKKPVAEELKSYFPATLELAFCAMIFAVGGGILTGIIAAVYRNGLFDVICMFFALLGVSMPIYWLAIMFIMQFSLKWGLLPVSGRLTANLEFTATTGFYLLDTLWLGIRTQNFTVFRDLLSHLLLPTIALGTIPLSIIARITRSSMLEVLGEDYIRTARAKGLADWWITLKHGFSNATIPIVTVIGLQTGFLLGGAILTEKVFSWPGIGNYILDAVLARDFPAIQGGVMLVATAFVVINLLVDLSYLVLDPRIVSSSGKG